VTAAPIPIKCCYGNQRRAMRPAHGGPPQTDGGGVGGVGTRKESSFSPCYHETGSIEFPLQVEMWHW
jgi:hypothetical protein